MFFSFFETLSRILVGGGTSGPEGIVGPSQLPQPASRMVAKMMEVIQGGDQRPEDLSTITWLFCSIASCGLSVALNGIVEKRRDIAASDAVDEVADDLHHRFEVRKLVHLGVPEMHRAVDGFLAVGESEVHIRFIPLTVASSGTGFPEGKLQDRVVELGLVGPLEVDAAKGSLVISRAPTEECPPGARDLKGGHTELFVLPADLTKEV